jgi:excisionase family DNA binding protein
MAHSTIALFCAMGRPKSNLSSAAIASGYIGTKDAAAMLGVSVSTIQKMVEAGSLEAWRTQGGHRRITLASVQREIARLPDPHAAEAHRALSVLVVEDNPVALKSYEHMFKQWGDRLVAHYAHDGAEALLRVAQDHPDVLITDIVMQPFDGHLLIRTLRANLQFADLHIVVVTGDESVNQGDPGFDARTVVYRKPLRVDRLAGYLDARLQDLTQRSTR